jgi:hypothetical protein
MYFGFSNKSWKFTKVMNKIYKTSKKLINDSYYLLNIVIKIDQDLNKRKKD